MRSFFTILLAGGAAFLTVFIMSPMEEPVSTGASDQLFAEADDAALASAPQDEHSDR